MSHVPSSLRQQLRERANQRCEYCRIPETYSSFPFQADHIIPQKHDGPTVSDNLVWACFRCNNMKGSDIAAYDTVTNELTPIFNPRLQNWDEHFEIVDAEIMGKTSIGRVTVRVLKMNHPAQVKTRRDLIEDELW